MYHHDNNDNNNNNNENTNHADDDNDRNNSHDSRTSSKQISLHRRHFLTSMAGGVCTTMFPILPSSQMKVAYGRGLVQFPCKEPLGNTYHLMRTGFSLLEEEDIWTTNPLFLTNREAALSPKGIEQVETAAKILKSDSRIPTTVRYSLAASAMDTANILGRELKLGRNILLPEYTFLDPRGIGQWESTSLSTTQQAIWALDEAEAGPDGMSGRPPPNEDGTPNETLADQVVRLRQLLSILETQYSGDTILLVFPDGTGPAVLSAMIAGIPLNRVHELEFTPGEVRLDVTLDRTQQLWNMRSSVPEYQQSIRDGQIELERLRSLGDTIVNLKDQTLEEERILLEQQVLERDQKRQEEQKMIQQQREQQQQELQQQRRRLQEERELRQQELMMRNKQSDDIVDTAMSSSSISPVAQGLAGLLAVGGVGVAAYTGDKNNEDDDNKQKNNKELSASIPPTNIPNGTTTISATNATTTQGTIFNSELNLYASTTTTSPIGTVVSPREEEVDPFEAAETAMEAYMNKDDGGEEWLQSIMQIANDDYEDDNDHDTTTTNTTTTTTKKDVYDH